MSLAAAFILGSLITVTGLAAGARVLASWEHRRWHRTAASSDRQEKASCQ